MSIYNKCTVSELQHFVTAAINIANIEGGKFHAHTCMIENYSIFADLVTYMYMYTPDLPTLTVSP